MFNHTRYIYTLVRHDGLVVSSRMEGAFSFLHRARGLLMRGLSSNGALWLRPGGSVHTFGMCFPIDVLFLNEDYTILAVAENIKPWRIKLAPINTRSTIELEAGRIARIGLHAGDKLFIKS